MRTNLTEEQLKHYLKGGKFKAIYNPKHTDDISARSMGYIGKVMDVWQGPMICPLQIIGWEGQHSFESSEIVGWFPEEDVNILETINSRITPQKLPQYIYELLYTTPEQIKFNFGNGKIKPPIKVYREYDHENDAFIMHLSDPQATEIKRAKYDGKSEKLKWETIFKK